MSALVMSILVEFVLPAVGATAWECFRTSVAFEPLTGDQADAENFNDHWNQPA